MLDSGVFLDLGSVSNRDLDLKSLEAALPQWRMHEHTSAAECAARIADADAGRLRS